MSGASDEPSFAASETVVRRLWASHGLPPPNGTLGRGSGPVLRQLVGTFTPGDPPVLVAQRAIAADVDARACALAGGRAFATLRREAWRGEVPDRVVEPLLELLAVWAGGADGKPYDAADRGTGIQEVTSRLARLGVLVVRDGPVRLCSVCAAPRSPERVLYHEEVGDTFLVRFPLEPEGEAAGVDALAWVDAPWRLLGTTGLLVNPDLTYATVEYRRGEVTARLLTLSSALGRLRNWLPGVELRVVDERPGRAFAGRRYVYPLRHEFPDGAALPAPSGTVQAVPEVGDSGTGVVPLVPGHGGSDAQIAERLGVQGWPLLTVRGSLDLNLMHKYAGLDLETANDFVARDLTEAGSVLARLRVLRGVPHCGVCGQPLVWFPGRCWCLEPAHLPAPQRARYAEILPRDRAVGEIEVTPWPVSETTTSDDPEAVRLLECDRCQRLDAPDGPRVCPCGGQRRVVGRRLVPSLAGAFAAWSRNAPVPPGDPVRLYLTERRRAPAVVHHLAAMAAVGATGIELDATILPTVTDIDLAGLVREHGADAVRAAFVSTDASEGPGGTFVERCRQEHHRLQRLTELARGLAASAEPAAGPLAGASPRDRDLEPEDRALLARWEATELRALAAYEELRPSEAHRRLWRFLEVDLARYRELARPRAKDGAGGSRRAAQRTLATIVAAAATALAPIAPFTAETVVRTLRPDPRSVFETEPFDLDRPPPDEALVAAWDRWLAVVHAVERFRADRRLAAGLPLPSVAVVVPDDELGDRLRGDRSLIERLAGVGRLEVGSPRSPWEGRRRQVVPVESEIQRAYPASSAQITHLLRRMPSRRAEDPNQGRGFSVFVQGQPHQITPEMLTVVESLPEGMVPTPFALGEMYVGLPGGAGAPGAATPLPLSADASWLVRRIARRLRPLGPETTRTLAVRVLAVDPLAKELREHWAAIARSLGVATLTIDPPAKAETPRPALAGRTRLGARWSVEIAGLEPRPSGPRRPTGRPPSRGTRRLPLRRPRAAAPAPPEVDFADEQVIHHEEELRALGEQLDHLLGAPLLGPAKVDLAWQAGFASLDELTAASFDELATLPGFGRSLAARFFTKLGRPVPPPPPRPRRREVVRPAATKRVVPSPRAAEVPSLPTEVGVPRPAPAVPSERVPTEEPSGALTSSEPREIVALPAGAIMPEPAAPPAPDEPWPADVPGPLEPGPAEAAEPEGVSLPEAPPTEPTPAAPVPGGEAATPVETTEPRPEPPGELTDAGSAVPEPVREQGDAGTAEPAAADEPGTPAIAEAPSLPEPPPAAETTATSGPAGPDVAPPETPAPTSPDSPYVPVPAPPGVVRAPRTVPSTPPPLEPAYLPESARARPSVRPAPEPTPAGLEVEVSTALLPALQPFLDATAAGHRGLAVIRELPERLRTLVGPRPVAVYWLSNLARERSIRPGDLAGIAALVRQGIAANGISAVFLEGVEYLARIHGSAAVLAFLKELDAVAREHDARAWLHLTPGLMSPGDLEQMLRELGVTMPVNETGSDAPPSG